MAIVDVNGRPYQPAALRDRLDRNDFYARTVVSRDREVAELTPAALSAALRQADEGRPAALQAIFDRIEDRDPHYWSQLQTRRLFVAERPLRVIAADASRKARKAADLCREHLFAIPELEEELVLLLSAIPRGYACSEIVWDAAEWRPARLRQWDHRLFVADPADPHTLRLLTERAMVDGEALAPGQWVTLKYRAKSGLPVRAGLGRIVAWYHVFKQFAVKDWLAFSELFGTPPRIGTYRPGSSPEDQRILERAVRGFGQDLAATMPEGMAIQFPDVGGKSASVDLYHRLATFCNEEISKAVLGQTLTTQQGDTGARSLGEVHERVLRAIVSADARALASALRQSLLRPLVAFHLGEGYPLPELSFDLQDRRELLERVQGLAKVRLPIGKTWLYESFGIPEPEEGDETVGGEAAPAPADAPTGQRAELAAKKKAPSCATLDRYL